VLQLLWVCSATDDAMDVFVDYISMVDVGEGFIYRCRWAAAGAISSLFPIEIDRDRMTGYEQEILHQNEYSNLL